MKNNKKLAAIGVALILVALAVGINLYKNSSAYIGSNSYLSSKEGEEKSVDFKKNDKDTQYGKSFDFGQFTGKWSLIEFNSVKGNKITINDKTKINKGIFYTVILNSDYHIIAKKNESNKNGNIDFTIPKGGKYIVRVVGQNATGTFNIKIDAAKKIKLSHKDFF